MMHRPWSLQIKIQNKIYHVNPCLCDVIKKTALLVITTGLIPFGNKLFILFYYRRRRVKLCLIAYERNDKYFFGNQ